jgi:PAS domain S-box-containing protein
MEEKARVLIVDDDPLARATLEALLFSEGYHLAFAGNGAEALAKASELVPDLILLDVMMPDMDGFEVCRRLRADPKIFEVPVIVQTSLDDRDTLVRAFEAGADDFVSKPLDMLELRARVRTVTWLNRRRQMRKAELRAERDRTRAILEALGEAVIVADLAGTIRYINPAAVDLTGFDLEEAVGRSWYLGHDDATDWHKQVEEAIRAGQRWQGEVNSNRKGGLPYDAFLTVAPLFDPDERGCPIGFVSVQRDITPLKEAERLKDRFVSNVSHELSTPLSVVTLVADNLNTLYEQLGDAKRRKMIQDIQRHAQVLCTLIDDILEVSRLDSGRVSTERSRLNLAQLVSDEVHKQLPLAREKSQQLSVTGAERLMVQGNDNQLRRVIRNLVNNAIKFTPQGGSIRCECRALIDSERSETEWPDSTVLPPCKWAALRVVDTGIGIAPQHMPHIFERFYRAETQANIRGTGLGLSIARELVELYRGHIAIASEPGKGSTCAVYLPLEE